MQNAREKLIIALDVFTKQEARRIIDQCGDAVHFYKIGYQLIYAGVGLDLAKELIKEKKRVFIDAKLLDIPNTVASAVKNVVQLGADFLTIHAEPGTMRAAVQAKSNPNLKIFGVSVLTSMNDKDLEEAGYNKKADELVRMRAHQAAEIGLDGLICAPTDIEMIRQEVGHALLLTTPGIRPASTAKNDQKRFCTPFDAIQKGADYLVVGRPVTAQAQPASAANTILAEMTRAL